MLFEVFLVSFVAGFIVGGNMVVVYGKGFVLSLIVSIGLNDVTVIIYVLVSELNVVVALGSFGFIDVMVQIDYGTANLVNGYFYVVDVQLGSV